MTRNPISLAVALLAVLLATAFATPAHAQDAAVSARQDAGRTGFLGGGTLGRPPLTRRFAKDLGSFVSAPLVVGNRVFVSHRPPGTSGSRVAAFDAATGAQIWSHTVPENATVAYGDGRVVALSESGAVLALNAADGTTAWATELGERRFVEITIADGLVFIGVSDHYYANRVLRLSDGSVAWRRSPGPQGPITVAGGLALQSDPCGTRAWDAATGEIAFRRIGTCSYSYSSGSLASAGGPVVARESSGRVLDIANGQTRDALALSGEPAIAGDVAVVPDSASVYARSLTTGATLWTSAGLDYSYGGVSRPTIVDGVAYVVRVDGRLQALDLGTGAELWSDPLDISYLGAADARIAAGGGALAVVAEGDLVVYGGAGASPGAGLKVSSGPEGPTQSAAATFAFTTVAGVTECRLDDAAWAPCAGSASYPAVADGPHTFTVRARVGDEVVGIAHRGFSVDRTAPESEIIEGPSGTTWSSFAKIYFTTDGGRSDCPLDGGAWTPCEESVTYEGLAEGDHVFAVRGTDPAGNVEDPPQERRFAVDSRSPVVMIDSRPPWATRSSDARVEFRVSEPGTVMCSWDYGPREACTSPAERGGFGHGTHYLEISVRDAAGNWGFGSVEWRVDTTAPETEIVDGPPATMSTYSSYEVHFRSEAQDAHGFECSMDGRPFVSCWSPHYLQNLPAGPHTFAVRARDEAGNVDPTPDEWSFTVTGDAQSTPDVYPTATPSPAPYTGWEPTPTPSPAPTAAPSGTNPWEAPEGYRVLMPEDAVAMTPAQLRDQLVAYLRARRLRTLARKLRITVPYMAADTGTLEVRLVVKGRTLARSRVPVAQGALAWPRLGIEPSKRRLLLRSRGGDLIITLAGTTSKTRLRWRD